MRHIVLLVVVLLCQKACVTMSQSVSATQEDADVFKLFWQKLNDMLTPQWASFNDGDLPTQLFLMEMPGFSVNGDDFSEEAWRRNDYSGSSPDYLSFQLVDTAPSFANYFVDSGFRISKMWAQFMLNAKTESPHDDPVREARYRDAVSRLYDENFAPRPIQKTRQALLDAWEAAFDEAIDNRYTCLVRGNQAPDLCAQKAVIWAEEVTAAWFAYETLNRDLMGTQSQILQLQSNDLHLLLSEALESFQSYRRSEIGTANLFATYYNVLFEPSDWWQWFVDAETNATEFASSSASAFVSVSIRSDETYQERIPTFERFFANYTTSARFDRPMMRVTAGSTDVEQGFVDLIGTATTTSMEISFEVAKVKIERPWLDLGLLRYSPIAITGLPAGAWSSAQVDPLAMFPLLPTSMIVARNVRISSTWSQEIADVLSNSTDPNNDVNVEIGPFNTGGNNNQYSREFSGSSSSSFDGSTLSITGPMVIGWVATTVPYFPNAAVDDLDLGEADLLDTPTPTPTLSPTPTPNATATT
jgi:hypothetical protein